MSTALYRRYRPETFEDVIGQEHVTQPLMQALHTGRVNHAYLFSGPRGCGKTTSARILARCLNCEKGPTSTPCGECDSCVALSRGGAGSMDVIEIDAASHGGVDDARDLREKASYGPAQSRYKVYIIDEAHMVTPQGFNALLKIVEEPPEHVKFIFATTEPEKVIGTIRSRTHHYPFRLVPPARLSDYLAELCELERVAVAPGVLSFVVRAGGGSVRDSLSILDQLIAGSGPSGLTYEGAAALLGFTDGELLDAVVNAFAAGDAATVFGSIDKVIETGQDPRRFVEDVLERLRDLIVIAAVPDGATSVLRGLPEDQVERMRTQAAAFGGGSLSRAADIVNAGLTEMTGATAPRLQLELIAARVLLPGAAGESGYAARLDRLERRLDVGGVPSGARMPVASPSVAAPLTSSPGPDPASAPPAAGGEVRDIVRGLEEPPPLDGEPGPAEDPASHGGERVERTAPAPAVGPGGIDVSAIRRAWPDVLAKTFVLKRTTWTLLSAHAQVHAYDGERLSLSLPTAGLLTAFSSGPHAELVRQALIDVLGVDARVDGVIAAAGSGRPPGPSAPAGSAGPSADSGSPPGAAAPGGPGAAGADPPPTATGPGSSRDASSRTRDAGTGDWATAAPPAATAPSWARVDPPGLDSPSAAAASPSPPSPARAQGQEASGLPGSAPGGRHLSAVPDAPAAAPAASPPDDLADEDLVSEDDEAVDEAAESGRSVVERLLGGTVIDEVND
ncbi:MAG: DNA polymerase III subunit gamma and tau [Nostocoides sp.]